MKQRRKKRAVTLIEIMVVILLIGLIGGALAFNMRGSMDKGRAFKTEQNIARVRDALLLEHAKGERDLATIVKEKKIILDQCPFLKNGSSLLKDGWGNEMTVKISKKDGELVITSTKLEKWNKNHE